MISDKQLAGTLLSALLQASGTIDHTVRLARDAAPPDEFLAYRAAVAKVLGEMLELVNPIIARHPDLKPSGWE
jgi:hypothetical protein